jgi:hypothetical protein
VIGRWHSSPALWLSSPALQEHIETLKDELQAQRAEWEAEHETLRGTVEALRQAPLRQALESERQLRDELRWELERLSRPWWRRSSRSGGPCSRLFRSRVSPGKLPASQEAGSRP